jgi:2-phospho-L-lactate transferase/gluconeogenesis factor (CofD/UPF0052 family)
MNATFLSPNGLARAQDSVEGEVEDDVFAVPVKEVKHTTTTPPRPKLTSRPASKGSDVGLGPTIVISGGSGYNELVGATPGATFVMPVSDNGGSSSEIIRVLGGPSIGDLRSRLVRMIPLSTDEEESLLAPPSNDALHALLSYRLPSKGKSREIKQEWMDILEGRHRLWRGIEAERKECVRGFLVYFESEILRRAHRNFNFRGGSIGNFFLAAAQKFFRSIQSAIFLFSATTLINTTKAGRVLPVINTNHTATIAASLQDGQIILGQCEISHPTRPREKADVFLKSGLDTPASAVFDPFQSTSLLSKLTVGSLGDGLEPDPENDIDEDGSSIADDDEERELEEDIVPTSHKARSRLGNIVFTKESETPDNLPARIERLFYVNVYGNEVQPAPNPEYISSLYSSRTLLYSCGSLWTSIVPCLALRGVATAITTSQSLRYKILLLNTTLDRETSSLTGLDFVHVIARSMAQSDGMETLSVHRAVTHIIYSPQGQIPLDVAAVSRLGIECFAVNLSRDKMRFDEQQVQQALNRITGTAL